MSQNVVFTVWGGLLSHGQLFPHGALQLIQLISGFFQKINAGAPTHKPLSTKTPPPGHSTKKSLCPGKAGRSDTWTTGLARQKLWWMVSGRPSAPRGKVGRPTTFRRGAKLARLGTAWPPWASARRNTIQMSLVSTARQQEYSAMFGEQLIQGITS